MILLRLCRNIVLRLLVALVIISSLIVPPAYSQETEDSQIFIAGFNAYQQKDYASSIEKMNEVLQKYPDTPLRDMALFWLSRSYFKVGNQQDAAKHLSQFSKEYPDNPLKSTVEEELLSLTARYEKGEKLPTGATAAKQPDRLAAQKARVEKERIAAVKAEEAKRAAAAAEAARVAAAKAEQERLAVAKAEEAKRIAAAETARLAALKQAEERASAEKREQERLAAVKAEEERLAVAKAEQKRIATETAAKEKAEQQRIAAIKEVEVRKAAELVEQQRIAAAQAEEAKRAAAAAEAARVAAAKAEQERLAVAKAEEAKRIAAAETARLAALKQAEERASAEKREQERLAAVKAEEERLAVAKAEQKRIAAEAAAKEKAEQQRIAAIKEVEVRKAAELVEQQRIAAAAAEAARVAAAKAEQERLAVAKAEEAKRIAAAETARVAQVEAELTRMNTLRSEEERNAAARRAESERVALAKAEEAKLAEAAAEKARLASLKAEDERKAAERSVKEEENRRAAALKAEESRLATQKLAEEKIKAAKLAYRERAIGQYKSIIDKFPASAAAVTAAAKLRELGVAVALPPQPVEAPLPENAQVLRIEVAQFAGFEFNLLTRPEALHVGRPVTVPFEIINRGNGKDSFKFESAFPPVFKATFASVTSPGIAVTQTPELAPGEIFKGVIGLTVPATSIDGLRITHTVKASSRLIAEASQSREVSLVASAPLLRAVVRTDKTKPLPGERVAYRVAILNVGSTVADDVSLRLEYPPQLEPVDFTAVGFRQEQKSALVFDALKINSGESREFTVAFQLKDDSLAGQELSTRAELVNNSIKTASSFVSNMAYVDARRGVVVRTGSDRIVAIPGQTITAPFVVSNSGNIREKFKISSIVTGAQNAVIFNDLNRDGIRQASESVITEIGPLAPREEASVVVEIRTPVNATDNSQGGVQISFMSEGDATRSASGSTQLTYSRPVLKMAMSGKDGRLKPGDVAAFDLTIVNNGSNIARIVELQSAWPEQLELIAADPANSVVSNGAIIWRFKELGAGEKRNINVSFRVKPGTSVGTAIQVKNILTYEDQLGNRY